MKFSPPILSCSNENICFQVGDYSFGFNGKDKESEFNSGAYDFGARIHDARLGRWMSVDRFVKQYASQTPYAYSNDSPILFIDIDGEKGTIYIQVMLDKNGKPVIDKATMKAVKKELERRYAELGVDLKIEVHYSNEFMTKKEFYSREGADKTDSYVVIGTPDQIISFDNQAITKLGWGKSVIQDKIYGLNGSTPQNGDQISLLNSDNLKKIGELEKFSSVLMKIARTIEHETLHPKIMDHPGLYNEAGPVPIGSGGHVRNTIMDANMNSDNFLYDRYMVEKLRNTHGTTAGANNMLLERFKEISYSNYSKQHPKMNMEDVKKEVNSMTTWILETHINSKPK